MARKKPLREMLVKDLLRYLGWKSLRGSESKKAYAELERRIPLFHMRPAEIAELVNESADQCASRK